MWSNTASVVCSVKSGLRFENNNYLPGKRGAVLDGRREAAAYPRPWIYYAAPVLLAVACFLNSLFGEFVHDDIPAVVNNPDVRGDTALHELLANDFWGKPMLDNTSHKSYRPLTVLTFRLNHMVGGYNPLGYHVTNVLLHALATLLFTRVCHKCVFRDVQAAGLAGTLFAAHPIHTEAVSGVVGRADVLCCVFFLLSYYAFHRCQWSGPGPPYTRRPGLLVACVLLAACATFSKEQGITVFGICVLSDLLSFYTNWTCRATTSKRTTAIFAILLRNTFLIICAAVCMAIRLRVQEGELPKFTRQDNPASFNQSFLVRCLTYSYLPLHNLWLLLVPVNLSYDWQMGSVPLVSGLEDLRVYAMSICAVIFGLLLRMVFRLKGTAQCSLACGLLVLTLPFLPAANVFFKVGFVIAERILYIPSMGYVVLLVTGARRLGDLGPAWRRNAVLTLGVLSVLFAGKTISRNTVWHNREELFKSGLISMPNNAKMHYNYANFLKDEGRMRTAESYYRNAIRLWPDYASAHNNLGTVVADPAESEWHYREALRLVPCHANAHFNLGTRLWKTNQPSDAIASLERAIQCDKTSTSPFFTLASVFRSLGDDDAAENAYRQALVRSPTDPRASYNMADFLHTQGRYSGGLQHIRTSLNIEHNNQLYMRLGGQLYSQLGETEEASDMFTRAARDSNDPTTLDMAGAFFLNISQTKVAIGYFRGACLLDPNVAMYKIHLAQALSKDGSHNEAKDVLEEVVATGSPNVDILIILANVYGNLNEHHKATAALADALLLAKDNQTIASIHLSLGKHYRDMKNMDFSFFHYLQAVSLNEELGEAHHNLGVFYHMQGTFSKASHHYKQALSLLPGNAVLKQNYAKLLKVSTSSDQEPLPDERNDCDESTKIVTMRGVSQTGLLDRCTREAKHSGGEHGASHVKDKYKLGVPDTLNRTLNVKNELDKAITNYASDNPNYADRLSTG